MPSSRRLTLTPEVRADLTDILQHSLANWGDVQSARYAEQIDRALANLARFPGIGQARCLLPPDSGRTERSPYRPSPSRDRSRHDRLAARLPRGPFLETDAPSKGVPNS